MPLSHAPSKQEPPWFGPSLVWPINDKEYGWRVGRIVDPFGHHWEIGKPLADG